MLALSDIAMLRDFGLVTLIDLSVSLLGVLVALPAALVIAERDEPLRLRGRAHAPLAAAGAPAARSGERDRARRAGRGPGSPHEPA